MSVAPTLSSVCEYAKVEQFNISTTIDAASITEVYHVKMIAEHIKSHGYRRPCLQFSDNLVQDSAHVASLLQRQIGHPVYVLADTSYSPCCVDEIAAQHVLGDVVYYFGNSCLNPIRTLPIIYVCRKEFDVNVEALKNQLNDKPTIIYPDTKYTDFALQLCSDSVAVAMPSSSNEFIPPIRHCNHDISYPELPNRKLTKDLGPLSECTLYYLTDEPSDSLVLFWSTVFENLKVVDGKGTKHNIHPQLQRRYRYVQNIKAAGTIGILVNTLSLKDTEKLLERTKRAITAAEKKFYMFVVGKPNVAKLGNFEVVDVWVILGCPQGGIILDNDDYSKPIVTPYELELAFNNDWTGKWILDFGQVLTQYESVSSGTNTTTHKDNREEDEPLFDLVTGKFVFGNKPLRQVTHVSIDGEELQTTSQSVAIRNTVSTAAQKLQQRFWRGLGSDHAEIIGDYAELKKGRSGIARNYEELM